MITEDYVSLEVAKLLKEKGFREPVYHSINKTYRDDRDDVSIWTSDRPENHNAIPEEKNHFCTYSCPTIQMAMKWLREVHKIHIQVEAIVPEYYEKDEYVYRFHYKRLKHIPIYNNMSYIDDTQYVSYEQACEAAIKHCLEHLI